LSDTLVKRNIFAGMKGMIIFVFLSVPFLLIIPLVVILGNQNIVILPATDGTERTIRVEPYNDIVFRGKSSIEDFSNDANGLVLKYTLRRQASNPMVFVSILLDVNGKPRDFSSYSHVLIRFKDTTSKRITLFIKTFVPGKSIPGQQNAVTLRHNQYVFYPSRNTHDLKIGLVDFTTGDWWYDMMRIPRYSLGADSYDKVMGFDIQCSFAETDASAERQEVLHIEKISIEKSISIWVWIIASIMFASLASSLVLIFLERRIFAKRSIPNGKSLEVPSYRDDELKRIREFIEAHYNVPDISTLMIYKELGIRASRVFRLVREEYSLSFKQLINRMRIEEAKRLLRETDRKVLAIAFDLGFNDISYFNRLFKQEEKMSPSEYREKHAKGK
jgi:AraC-like DNA-binding protein